MRTNQGILALIKKYTKYPGKIVEILKTDLAVLITARPWTTFVLRSDITDTFFKIVVAVSQLDDYLITVDER